MLVSCYEECVSCHSEICTRHTMVSPSNTRLHLNAQTQDQDRLVPCYEQCVSCHVETMSRHTMVSPLHMPRRSPSFSRMYKWKNENQNKESCCEAGVSWHVGLLPVNTAPPENPQPLQPHLTKQLRCRWSAGTQGRSQDTVTSPFPSRLTGNERIQRHSRPSCTTALPITWKPMPFTNTVCSSLCHTRSPGRAGADRLADGRDTSIASPPAAAAALLRFCGTSLPSTSRLVPGLPTRCKRQTNSRVRSVRMEGTQGWVGGGAGAQACGRLTVRSVQCMTATLNQAEATESLEAAADPKLSLHSAPANCHKGPRGERPGKRRLVLSGCGHASNSIRLTFFEVGVMCPPH